MTKAGRIFTALLRSKNYVRRASYLPDGRNGSGDTFVYGKVWQEHGVTLEMFRAEKEKKIPVDSPVYPYYQKILAFLQSRPELFVKPSQQG